MGIGAIPSSSFNTNGWGHDIVTDAAGNVYLTGAFSGTVDFDPAHPGTVGVLQSRDNAQNAFVAKYAADGAFLWAVRMGASNTVGKALAVDDAGNVYAAGGMGTNADFGSFISSSGNIYLTKIDANGNFKWLQTYADGDSWDMDVAVDGSGGVYMTHTINPSGVDYNPNLFVVVDKLVDNGTSATPAWHNVFGNAGLNFSTGIEVDDAGHVFVSGTFTGTVNFNPDGNYTLTSPRVRGRYEQQGFLLQLTASNGFGWAKKLDSIPTNIALDGAGNVYTTGMITASGKTPKRNSDGLMSTAKYSATGDIQWSKQFSTTASSLGVAVSSSGHVYTSGFFSETANFNPDGTFNLTSAGERDAFVSELDVVFDRAVPDLDCGVHAYRPDSPKTEISRIR